MAGVFTGQVSEIALASSTAKNVLYLKAASDRTVRLLEVSFSIEESDPSLASTLIELYRVASGTVSGTAVSLASGDRKLDTEDADYDSTCKHSVTGLTLATAPVVSEYVAKGWTYRPASPLMLRPGEEIVLKATPPASNLTCAARFVWQEV